MDGISRVLIVGATGRLGRHLALASLSSGHPTYALVRPTTLTSSPEKSQLLQSLISSGLQVVQGSLEDYPVLVEAIKQVDVVISAVGSGNIMDQENIIRAIKQAGSVKRILIQATTRWCSYIQRFIKGDHIYFSIEDSGVEGTELYPDHKYTTISEYLDTLL